MVLPAQIYACESHPAHAANTQILSLSASFFFLSSSSRAAIAASTSSIFWLALSIRSPGQQKVEIKSRPMSPQTITAGEHTKQPKSCTILTSHLAFAASISTNVLQTFQETQTITCRGEVSCWTHTSHPVSTRWAPSEQPYGSDKQLSKPMTEALPAAFRKISTWASVSSCTQSPHVIYFKVAQVCFKMGSLDILGSSMVGVEC